MTWTGSETPHEGAAEATGLGGGVPWQAPPLPSGALGADPVEDDDALLPDLPPLPLAGPLDEALTTVRSGADAAAEAACHLASVGAHQRLEALQRAARTRDVLDAALLRLTATFTPEEVRTLGATSLTDLVLTHTGARPERARTEVKLAAALTAPTVAPPTPDGHGDGDGDGPTDADPAEAAGAAEEPGAGPGAGSSQVCLGHVGAAHAAGTLSTDVAALALRTVDDLPARIRRTHGHAADATLARLLPGLTHAQAQLVCTSLAHRLDPSRADRGFDPDDIDKRYVDLTVHPDGFVDVRARLDPVVGAELKAALDHLSKPDPTVTAPLADQQDVPLPGLDDSDDGDDGDADHGDPAGAGTSTEAEAGQRRSGVRVRDPRTAGQRRADALARLVRAGRASDETGSAEPARVIVTTTADALDDVPGAPPAHCETTGRPLSRAALRVLACSGSLQAVRLSCRDADASALSLGRAVRLFTAAQRRALLARDGGCVIPGCTAPPVWLEAHHVHEWAQGGPTDVAQGVLLCTRHHVLVTLGVWEVRMKDGVPRVRPPRTVDPLRRWVLNPRRALQQRTTQHLDRVDQLSLRLPPDPPDAASEVPDIPSPRGTCGC